MGERKREAFIDKLRVAATCAVVLLHTVTGIMDVTYMEFYPLEKKVFLVALDLICWCVPVFVLISGYLFLNPEREISFRRMLTKYCKRIALALLVFGIPYACLEQIAAEKTFRPEMPVKGFLMVLQGKSWSHLWYLYLILFLYLITPALKWLLKRTPRFVIYVVLAALLIGGSVMPFIKKLFALEGMAVLPDGVIYLFYYICGYLFALYKKKLYALKKELPCVLAFLAAALMIGMSLSRLSGEYLVQMAYNYPFTVVLSLLLFAAGLTGQGKAPEKGSTGIWERTGALCFSVYLIHPVFVNIYYKFLHVSPLDFAIGVSLPLFYLAILLPAVFFAWLLRKISLLRKWVL